MRMKPSRCRPCHTDATVDQCIDPVDEKWRTPEGCPQESRPMTSVVIKGIFIAAIVTMMLFAFVLSYCSDRPNFPENLSTGGLTCSPGNATLCAENVKSAAEKAWKEAAPERRKECASNPDYQELILCLARL
jgi:hypothetical protein